MNVQEAIERVKTTKPGVAIRLRIYNRCGPLKLVTIYHNAGGATYGAALRERELWLGKKLLKKF